MANFLVTSPSSQSVGTTTADLFDLDVTNGVSVFGTEGADTITATNALVGTEARLNGGKGADTITFSGGTLGSSEVLMGMGKDIVNTDSDLTATIVRGGAGLDTISVNSILLSSTVNGNDMADVISAGIGTASQSSLIAAGLGADVLSAVFVSGSVGMSVRGGAGHDSITFVQSNAGNQSALVVAGGNGIDTITFDVNTTQGLTGASNINGDDQNDSLLFGGDLAAIGTATIGGGLGADTIRFTGGLTTFTNGAINGGAGLDSIYISAEFAGGSLNGGAGVDTITFTDYITGDAGGIVFGDAGADIINLGNDGNVAATTGTILTGGRTLGYSTFDQSNLANMDVVSAGITFAGSGTVELFKVQSDVVDMSIADGIAVSDFTGTNGLATFTSTFAATISDRVSSLDATLTQGQSIAFTDNTDFFVFVQGGAAKASGTGDDLVLKLDNTAISDLTLVNVSSFIVRNTTAG